MAGRYRKSTALHLVEGTARPHRMNPDEPDFPVGAPEKPAIVAANLTASEEWDRILPMLLTPGVMSPVFRTALEAYCLSYADVVAAEAVKGREGFVPYIEDVTVDGAGVEHRKLRPHPALAEARQARKELRQAATQLGLTPASSAKVTAKHASEKVGIRAFQARRQAIGTTEAAGPTH